MIGCGSTGWTLNTNQSINEIGEGVKCMGINPTDHRCYNVHDLVFKKNHIYKRIIFIRLHRRYPITDHASITTI